MKVNLRTSVPVALVWAAGILLLAPSGASAQHIVDSILLPCPVELPEGEPTMAVNARDHILYYGTDEGDELLAIDERRGAVLFTLELEDCLAALCYNAKYNRLYCATATDEAVLVLDGTTALPVDTVALTDAPTAFVLDSSLDRLYALCWDGTIAAIDCASERVLSATLVTGCLDAALVCYAAELNRIYFTTEDYDTIYCFDCRHDSVLARIAVGVQPADLCFNPANGLLYVSLRGSDLLLAVDPAAGLVVDSAVVPGGWGTLCFDPRSRRVCGGGRDWLYAVDGASNRISDSVDVGGLFLMLGYSPRQNHIYLAVPRG